MSLANHAEISARHLSCVETGKAQPSREMVLVLCSALEVPLRERNVLLKAAGFAPAYRESSLFDPAVAAVRRTCEFLLERHSPYPAIAIDAQWNVLMTNEANKRFGAALLPAGTQPPTNLLHGLFDPAVFRPRITNFETVARTLFARVSRDAITDERSQALLDELRAYPDLPADLNRPVLEPPELLIALHIDLHGTELCLMSTITTLGTAMDITLQELRIESYFPGDDKTRRYFEDSQ